MKNCHSSTGRKRKNFFLTFSDTRPNSKRVSCKINFMSGLEKVGLEAMFESFYLDNYTTSDRKFNRLLFADDGPATITFST